MKPKTIIIFILILLLLIILIQNTQVVTFHLLFWKISMSRIVLLVVTICLGFVIGILIHPLIFKKKKKLE